MKPSNTSTETPAKQDASENEANLIKHLQYAFLSPRPVTAIDLANYLYTNNQHAEYLQEIARRARAHLLQMNMPNRIFPTQHMPENLRRQSFLPGQNFLQSTNYSAQEYMNAIYGQPTLPYSVNATQSSAVANVQKLSSSVPGNSSCFGLQSHNRNCVEVGNEYQKKSEVNSTSHSSNVTKKKEKNIVREHQHSLSKSRVFIKNIQCKPVQVKHGSKVEEDLKRPFHMSRQNELPQSILNNREERDKLKKNGEPFVQDAPCYEISKMGGVETSGPMFGLQCWHKCRECRSAKQKDSSTVFCRFYGFRKVKFVDGQLCTAGFLLPEDCTDSDIQLWLPVNHCLTEQSLDIEEEDIIIPSNLVDRKMSKFILQHIGKQFCELVKQERKALSWIDDKEKICWKRPVSGVREMCDVCETTLFNMHWFCPECGFGVCLDCFERRLGKTPEEQEIYDSDRRKHFRWLRCTKGRNHFHCLLLPTQIIASTCLWDLNDMVHKVADMYSLEDPCSCLKVGSLSDEFDHLFSGHHEALDKTDCMNSKENCNIRKRAADDSSSDESKLDYSSKRKNKERKTISTTAESISNCETGTINLSNLIKTRIENKTNSDASNQPNDSEDVLFNWWCNERLLQLTDSQHSGNTDLFKVHWQHGMPVVVSGIGAYLHMYLWHPNYISQEYGDENSRNSLVNCITGSIITNMKIHDFWDGFENISQRLLDENKKTMILKLKDWPTTQHFHEVMPDKFVDLMNALPLPDYTSVSGKCNLASRLPRFFVKPDLGPKMYNAYGWVTESDWKQGTTNLHLDISDAINIMVYVGIPVDEPPESQNTLIQIVKEGEVDEKQMARIYTDKPGALWHIFHQQDVDKIRKFIKKICKERGETLPHDHDPIHDQQMYLDKELRHRLFEEYGVEGYAIMQCQGDGIFIPAGAPHQVFNLHSCVKIAEDFVSPEHVDKCFMLTNEFRYLSSTHSNHEDKLQIKNIIYHSIKDIVSTAIHTNCCEAVEL